VADWGSGMSAGCTAGQTAAAGTRQPHNALVVTLTHANQLPLRGW